MALYYFQRQNKALRRHNIEYFIVFPILRLKVYSLHDVVIMFELKSSIKRKQQGHFTKYFASDL